MRYDPQNDLRSIHSLFDNVFHPNRPFLWINFPRTVLYRKREKTNECSASPWGMTLSSGTDLHQNRESSRPYRGRGEGTRESFRGSTRRVDGPTPNTSTGRRKDLVCWFGLHIEATDQDMETKTRHKIRLKSACYFCGPSQVTVNNFFLP